MTKTTKLPLKVYLIPKEVKTYEDAIQALEDPNLKPLDVWVMKSHISGAAAIADRVSTIELLRPLGARPRLKVVDHGMYSTVRLSDSSISSLICTINLTGNPGSDSGTMISVFCDCDIIAIDVDASGDDIVFEERIPVQARRALPWAYIEDILSEPN